MCQGKGSWCVRVKGPGVCVRVKGPGVCQSKGPGVCQSKGTWCVSE